jgi:hypothetical protein
MVVASTFSRPPTNLYKYVGRQLTWLVRELKTSSSPAFCVTVLNSREIREMSTLSFTIMYVFAIACLAVDEIQVQSRRDYFYVGGEYVDVVVSVIDNQLGGC